MTGVLLGVVVLMLCKVYMDSNQWRNYKRVRGPTTGINFKESDERGWRTPGKLHYGTKWTMQKERSGGHHVHKGLTKGQKERDLVLCVESCKNLMARHGYLGITSKRRGDHKNYKRVGYRFKTKMSDVAVPGRGHGTLPSVTAITLSILGVWMGVIPGRNKKWKTSMGIMCVLIIITVTVNEGRLEQSPPNGITGGGEQCIPHYEAILAGLIGVVVVLSIFCICLG